MAEVNRAKPCDHDRGVVRNAVSFATAPAITNSTVDKPADTGRHEGRHMS